MMMIKVFAAEPELAPDAAVGASVGPLQE